MSIPESARRKVMETNWLKMHGHTNWPQPESESQHTAAYRLPATQDTFDVVCSCGMKLSFTGPWTYAIKRREEFLAWWSALPTLDQPYDAKAMAQEAEALKTRQTEILAAVVGEIKVAVRRALAYAHDHELVLAERAQLE